MMFTAGTVVFLQCPEIDRKEVAVVIVIGVHFGRKDFVVGLSYGVQYSAHR